MWRSASLAILILGVFVVVFFFLWKSLASISPIEVSLRSEHPLIISSELNKEVISAFLEKIRFAQEQEYYLVEERIRISRKDIKFIEIIFTDVPQLGRETRGEDNTLIQSVGYQFQPDEKKLVARIYLNPEVFSQSTDKKEVLNFRLLTVLYFPLYLRYDEAIRLEQFDLYGFINREVIAFMKEQPNVSSYEFSQ